MDQRALIGRSRAQARAGSRQVVLLSGEPGIGKTRLAAHEALAAHAEGFAVVWGSCSEDLAVPYEPWIDVCAQLVEHADDELLRAYVERSGGEIARLARNLALRVPGAPELRVSDPETERFTLFNAVADLLRAVAVRRPVCVVLDDLHWADAQSVVLFKHVAHTGEPAALQLIVTYRDSDLTKDHPLTAALADLRRVDCVERVALTGLGADEVAQLLSAAAGHDLDADGLALAGEIATETGGNPFFAGEILRNLTESGAIAFDERAARWSVDRSVARMLPESVRDVIEHRVERLGDDGRAALTIAAVIGRSFDVELLAELVEMSESRLLDRLEAAVASSLLRESDEAVGQFSFEHALINDTLYQGLGASRRARIHRRIAEALEALYGPDPREHLAALAMHWRLATAAVDRRKAAHYAYRAGRKALDELAPAEAARLFADAVEMVGSGETAERCRALIGLGEAQRLVGDNSYRDTLLDASRIGWELGDAELTAQAALANNRGFSSVIGEIDHDRLAAIERAIELDDGADPARRARLLALKAMELEWAPHDERPREQLEEAIALARSTGEARAIAEVLRGAMVADWSPATLERRCELAPELVDRATAAGDPALRWWAHELRRLAFAESGEWTAAEADMLEQEHLAHELGQPTYAWYTAWATAGMDLVRGRLQQAEQLAERALRLGEQTGQPDAALIYGAQMAYIRVEQGGAAEIIPMLEQGVTAYAFMVSWRAGLAYAYTVAGQRADAAAILDEAAKDSFAHVPWDMTRMSALAMYSGAAVEAGRPEVVAMLAELVEPWADQMVFSNATGYGHVSLWLGRLLARLGRHEESDRRLALACTFHEAHGHALWAAHSHVSWAKALAERREPAAAEHAARALELARAHGYGAVEAAVAAISSPARRSP